MFSHTRFCDFILTLKLDISWTQPGSHKTQNGDGELPGERCKMIVGHEIKFTSDI